MIGLVGMGVDDGVVVCARVNAQVSRRALTACLSRSPASEAKDPYHALPALEINGVAQDVREGTRAIRAYEAMMYGVEKSDAAAKQAWGDLLKQYCKLDTLSMVLIFEYWRRATPSLLQGCPINDARVQRRFQFGKFFIRLLRDITRCVEIT